MDEYHTCHFCGESVDSKGYTYKRERHFLSDCRPDLVEHEIGDICTWATRREPLTRADGTVMPAEPPEKTCYAYQDENGNWTKEHKHFFKDGPM